MITPAMLHRRSLKYFLREVFRQLHPDEPPLELGWYLQAICHALEETWSGGTRRLVVNAPPRYLKSITAAVAFSAWLLGQDPRLRILVATGSEQLARLHHRNVRRIMESPEYRTAFPATAIDRGRSRLLDLQTTAGGFRVGVTTGGTATGFGGDVLILDGCLKPDLASSQAERERLEQWFRATMSTRLDRRDDGVVVAIQQRLHERDLAALLIEAGAARLDLPAIAPRPQRITIAPGCVHHWREGELLAPDRDGRESLRRQELLMGRRNFSLQFLQDTVATTGGILRLDWFPRYEKRPARGACLRLVQSWDTAMSAEDRGSFSVCTTWGYRHGRWLLLDVFRERLDYPDLKRAVVRLFHRWRPDEVLIENATAGPALAAELSAEGPFRPVLRAVRRGKEERLAAQTARLEAGFVGLPLEAPWLDAFCAELLAAPKTRHWDQIDSLTQFLEHVTA